MSSQTSQPAFAPPNRGFRPTGVLVGAFRPTGVLVGSIPSNGSFGRGVPSNGSFGRGIAERVQHWLKLIIDFVKENSDVFESWGLDSDGAKSFRVLLYGKSFFDDNQTAIRTRELSQRCGRVANNALIYSSYSSSLALIWTHTRNFSKGF